MKEHATAFRLFRAVEKGGFLKKNIHRRPPVEGGGSIGVAQVVLGVSIEGSRGSRICGGRAARRGRGEISSGSNRKANWFWQVWGTGSNAVFLKGSWGNIQQTYEIIRGTIQKAGERKDSIQNTGPADDPEGTEEPGQDSCTANRGRQVERYVKTVTVFV